MLRFGRTTFIACVSFVCCFAFFFSSCTKPLQPEMGPTGNSSAAVGKPEHGKEETNKQPCLNTDRKV